MPGIVILSIVITGFLPAQTTFSGSGGSLAWPNLEWNRKKLPPLDTLVIS